MNRHETETRGSGHDGGPIERHLSKRQHLRPHETRRQHPGGQRDGEDDPNSAAGRVVERLQELGRPRCTERGPEERY